MRNPSFEGRFVAVSKIYQLLCGGQLADKPLRDRLNAWSAVVPKCETVEALQELMAKQDAGASTGCVLSTIHAAKGGEWDHVFVLGLADGALPDYRHTSWNQIKEERGCCM